MNPIVATTSDRQNPTSGVRRNRDEEDNTMSQPLFDSQALPFRSHLLKRMYIGHFLARWGPRMWEFSVGLYMLRIWPDSLLFAAIYGAVESVSSALFGPIVGQWVNRLSYLRVLQLWCLTQFLSSVVAGASVIGLLLYSNLYQTNSMAFISLVVLTNVSGAVAVLSTLAGTILIEREWAVVIAEGHPEEILTRMNSMIRRIDLICKLGAPVVIGFIISFASLTASAMTLALWNASSARLQYWLLMSVHQGIPVLSESSQKKIAKIVQCVLEESPSVSEPVERLLANDGGEAEQAESRSERGQNRQVLKTFIDAWKVYLRQDVVLPGVALALLYFTVLSFGSLMTATLQWEGIPTYIIGIARGMSATIGIAATVLYPILQYRISTLRTGLWAIFSLWTCLLLCVYSIWIGDHILAAYMLIAGVATARLGLWTFDLSVTQQMQDAVPESDRCVVGGVQDSLQSILGLMAYVVGMIIPKPQDFWKLVLLSYLAITLAAALYIRYFYRIRKHIFHFEKVPMLVRSLADKLLSQ